MGSGKDRNLVTNNSQFYFLIPSQLLETCRREAAKTSISTAAFMRKALVAYLAQQDMNDATASPGTPNPIHTDIPNTLDSPPLTKDSPESFVPKCEEMCHFATKI